MILGKHCARRTTLDGLRNLNAMLDGTALPRLDEAKIKVMIARDTLALLDLA